MDIKAALDKLSAIGRVNPKPAKAPKSTDPFDKFKVDLEKQIEDADFFIKNGFPETKSASRWISKTGDTYSVKFGNPAVAVGDAGNKYFSVADLKEAKSVLELGRTLSNDPTFQAAVRNAKSARKPTQPEPTKPRRGRKPKAA